MKKLFIASVFILPIVLISCGENKYRHIEESFKEYVANNFDDPNSLQEIVSITPVDTFRIEDYKKISADLLSTYEASDQAVDSLWAEIKTRIEKFPKGSIARMPNSDKFQSLYYANLNLIKQEISLANREDFVAPSMPAEISEHSDTTIISYCIKYRYNTAQGLKIDSIYANSDTSNVHVLICKDLFPDKFGQNNADFIDSFTQTCTSWRHLIDINTEKIRYCNKMISWLENAAN